MKAVIEAISLALILTACVQPVGEQPVAPAAIDVDRVGPLVRAEFVEVDAPAERAPFVIEARNDGDEAARCSVDRAELVAPARGYDPAIREPIDLRETEFVLEPGEIWRSEAPVVGADAPADATMQVEISVRDPAGEAAVPINLQSPPFEQGL